MNQAVWLPVVEKLSTKFRVKCLDIAGFGNKSQRDLEPYTLAAISDDIANDINEPGIIAGWSLGGLVAQYLALHHPSKLTALITIASTPYFQACQTTDWPGIKPAVLSGFQQQLAQDYQVTLERFLAIQAMGSPTAKQDIRQLKQQLLEYPSPHLNALKGGLTILEQADLRKNISNITLPTLRLYGRLDALVPQKAIEKIKVFQPSAESVVFAKASHAPFISHLDDFIEEIIRFSQNLK
ncbi:pimeloyl-[acyl-carrier protein] methyl ester esterase [Saccharobesus litoralis]|uniref:Pimeloyl-[acyl-carrier protein] methyl ester esterase n=2 Tax=Saccharobesus litoralis TaxID=2172099 RepID=A0A2S0VXU1_9ALTE|nr:pimeloyl-[acyl-carrier protein] methyl ester esterase [Saccharobesus litoralis]